MDRRDFLRLALAGAALPVMGALGGCNQSDDGTTQAESLVAESSADTLRVGMECAYAPFNWTQDEPTTPDGSIAEPIYGSDYYAYGYDVAVAQMLAAELDMGLEIHKVEWSSIGISLDSGDYDCIIAGMSPTEERKTTIDFSEYYWESSMCLVVKKDGPYADAKTLDDLEGAILCAQADTSHYAVLSQAEEHGATINPAMEGFTPLTTALVSGAIDGYTCETPSAQAAVFANPDLTYIEDVGFEFDPVEVSTSIAVRKDSGLNTTIDGIISGISKDERLDMMQKAVERQPLSEE